MDRHIIYGNHLQIVEDRERHEQLKAVQLARFPESIIITPAVMLLHHTNGYIEYLDQIRHMSPNAVWYLLPVNTSGALKGYQCNGVRYGTQPSDYTSLSQIQPLTGE